VTKFWGRQLRFRPTRDVVEDILRSRAKIVLFTDDNFFADPQRAHELCEALAPLRIRFICQIDSTARKRDALVRAAARAGCFLAFIGFESLSSGNLAELNKRFNHPDEYAGLIRMLRANAIGVYASIMLGLEQDDFHTADETVGFLIRHKVDIAAFFRLTPFPGTALYDRMKEKRQLVDEQWWLRLGAGLSSLIRYDGNSITADALVRRANRAFYSLGSIVRRYSTLKASRLVPLLLNLQSRKKMIRSGGSCSF
jgi:radical SAM superfamily enzyme YgiQ (UPF0313 family)